MHNPSYVQVSRTGVLYFRWPIPKRLHPQGKASTIRVSLRTRDPKEALRLARFLSVGADKTNEHGVRAGMEYEEIRAALRQHFAKQLANRKQAIREAGPLDHLDRIALSNSMAQAADAAAGKDSIMLLEDDTALLARFIEHSKLPIQPGTREYKWLRTEFPKAFRDYCKSALALDTALAGYDFSEPEPAKKQVPEPEPQAPSIPLSEAVERYMAQELRAGRWNEHTEATRRPQLARLTQLVGGDTDLARIGKAEARAVSDKLQKLPKNLNKSPAFRGMSLEEVLATDHNSGMHVTTLNDYLNTYSMLFDWAEKQGYVQADPFNGMQLSTPKSGKNERRLAFTDEQLRRIEHTLLTDLDGKKPKQSHKWASLIAMYTGARAGEVCQLRTTDIRKLDDIWCFSINDMDEGKRVKTQASVRVIPVHSRLIELGLLDLVKMIEPGRLFPDYPYAENYGFSKNLSVWFNTKLLSRLGLKSKQLVLHSLRHTMNTKLHHADVQEAIVKAIAGHTDTSMSTGNYLAAGFKPKQLQAAIEKFSIRE